MAEATFRFSRTLKKYFLILEKFNLAQAYLYVLKSRDCDSGMEIARYDKEIHCR